MIVIGQGGDCWFHREGPEVSALQAVERAKRSRPVGRLLGAAGAFTCRRSGHCRHGRGSNFQPPDCVSFVLAALYEVTFFPTRAREKEEESGGPAFFCSMTVKGAAQQPEIRNGTNCLSYQPQINSKMMSLAFSLTHLIKESLPAGTFPSVLSPSQPCCISSSLYFVFKLA